MAIRVLVAEAHSLVREGLRMILEADPELNVVATVGDGKSALTEIGRKCPAVVVMDVALPMVNGIEIIRRLVSELFSPKVLCLSSRCDSQALLAALSAGASGYILKAHSGDELVRAIHIVHDGGTYLSPRVANEVVAGYVEYRRSTNVPSVLMQLTSREREILQLTAEGFDSHQAGEHLGVSAKTVYSHLEHVMRKLNARSVADLTRYAVREGVTTL